MTVKINRDTGWIGMGSSFRLIVNGKKTEKIKNNETIQITLPEKEATIKATQWGVKTNEIVVKSGDELDLVTTSWGNNSLLLLILFMFFMQLLPNIVVGLLLIVLALIVFGVYFYFVDGSFFRFTQSESLEVKE